MFLLVLCVLSGIFQFGWFPIFKETENKSWSNKSDKIVFSFKKGFFYFCSVSLILEHVEVWIQAPNNPLELCCFKSKTNKKDDWFHLHCIYGKVMLRLGSEFKWWNGYFSSSSHCSVLLKPFCGILTVTLNNWNEGRGKESEPQLSRKCYVFHLGRSYKRHISRVQHEATAGTFLGGQSSVASGHQLFYAPNQSMLPLIRSWLHVLSLPDWAWGHFPPDAMLMHHFPRNLIQAKEHAVKFLHHGVTLGNHAHPEMPGSKATWVAGTRAPHQHNTYLLFLRCALGCGEDLMPFFIFVTYWGVVVCFRNEVLLCNPSWSWTHGNLSASVALGS